MIPSEIRTIVGRTFKRLFPPRTTIQWDGDTLVGITVAGPFPDHGEVAPGEASGVFRVRLSNDLVSVKLATWQRAVPNEAHTAELQWRDGELVGLSVSGEFAEHGDVPPIETERLFRLYRAEGKLILKAVDPA